MGDKSSSLHAIHDALIRRGFVRDWSASPRAIYVGRLDPSDLGLLVSVEVTDPNFIRPVAIRLREADLARKLPHILTEDLSLCYFEGGGIVFDRYDPGGTILQCLDQAERVVRDAVRGRLDDDFAAELSSYWGDRFVFTDVATDMVGECSIYYLATSREGTFLPVLCVPGSGLHTTHARHSRHPPVEEACTVLSVARRLSLDATSAWPPKTLAELKSMARGRSAGGHWKAGNVFRPGERDCALDRASSVQRNIPREGDAAVLAPKARVH